MGDPARAAHSKHYFKAGKGEYGEGDRFLGIRVPALRDQVKRYQSTTLNEVQQLLRSAFHEERLFALLLLVRQFKNADEEQRRTIYWMYLNNSSHINNWDLVDSSAPHIVGAYLVDKDRKMIHRLSTSDNLWERRIAVMSMFHFIKLHQFDDSLSLAMRLIDDREDLIQKAVGWMLREIGKRDLAAEKDFLKAHYKRMPRTMLRYAIERFPERVRKKYLQGTV